MVVNEDSLFNFSPYFDSGGKYLGYLDVGFDAEGVVKTFNGNPIFLDASIPQGSRLILSSNMN